MAKLFTVQTLFCPSLAVLFCPLAGRCLCFCPLFSCSYYGLASLAVVVLSPITAVLPPFALLLFRFAGILVNFAPFLPYFVVNAFVRSVLSGIRFDWCVL